MVRIVLGLISCLFVLSSCGPSKYTARNDTWNKAFGYDDMPIDRTTYQITYRGDGTLTSAMVDRYALYRCAELTNEKGFDYFVVLDAASEAGAITSAPTHHTEIEHDIDPQSGQFVPVAVTTTETTSIQTHTVTKTIRLFKGKRPDDKANAFDAKSMLKVMGPTIQR